MAFDMGNHREPMQPLRAESVLAVLRQIWRETERSSCISRSLDDACSSIAIMTCDERKYTRKSAIADGTPTCAMNLVYHGPPFPFVGAITEPPVYLYRAP